MTRHPSTAAMLAVSALEGWEPGVDDDEVLDLIDRGASDRLIRLRVLEAIPPEALRRPRPGILSRRAPYYRRGTRVLENSLGITSARALARAEALLVVAAGARLLRAPASAPTTVSGIHAALFGDVYAWAGLPRIVDLAKQGSVFAAADHVPTLAAPLERPTEFVADALASARAPAPRRATIALALADWYARFNHVHPFREGNGRAAAVAALLAARAHGADLDFTRTTRQMWVQAAVSSLPTPPRRTVDPTAHRFEFLRVTMDRSGERTPMDSPGRPRLVDRRRPGDTPADEILDAAAELFTTRGYTATSTRAIADAVGLRQASLYTHFPTKAAILVSLLDSTVGPTLERARRLRAEARDPRETLLTLATIDVEGLLASRWNIGMLYVLPEVAGEDFAGFRSARTELRGIYRELVALCRPDLDPSDPTLDLPFRVVEAVIPHRQDHPGVAIDPAGWAAAATRVIGIG